MKNYDENVRPEVALVRGAIGTLLAAIITAVCAFVPVTDDQRAALLGLAAGIASAAPFVVAWLIRGQVTSLIDPRDNYGSPLYPYDPDVVALADEAGVDDVLTGEAHIGPLLDLPESAYPPDAEPLEPIPGDGTTQH
jgi:hypothetical protein